MPGLSSAVKVTKTSLNDLLPEVHASTYNGTVAHCFLQAIILCTSIIRRTKKP